MLIFVLVLLGVVSVILAIVSLRNVLKMQELTRVKEDLSKSKVLYQRDSPLSSSSSSGEESSF